MLFCPIYHFLKLCFYHQILKISKNDVIFS